MNDNSPALNQILLALRGLAKLTKPLTQLAGAGAALRLGN